MSMIATGTEFERILDTNTDLASEMPAFSVIEVGDKVEIATRAASTDISCKSKIVNVLDAEEKKLALYVPSYGGKPFRMLSGEEYSLVVHTRDSLIKFSCSFEGYIKQEENYFVVIKILDEGIKLQRREFFRFTCMLAMKFSLMYTGDNEVARLLQNSGYTKMHNGIIRDIGGGGVRFITNEDIESGSQIQCTIMLGHTAMLIKGKILDKQYMPKSSLKFQYRAMFVDVSQTTQDEIVNFIFAEQRKQKKFRKAPTL
ncbi:MAG: PilZ domain-containing protein [Defluviitaleaceae bacterium]|nr:PilZ domain-containing protein [Defluviitaleaceae bacterium]